MGRFLHFGAGPNQLPAPWENLNAEHDIRKRLKFEDNSASGIHCEHVIEHVGLEHGLGFLREACRVLEPLGKLRVIFPDVTRFLTFDGAAGINPNWPAPGDAFLTARGFNLHALSYARSLTERHPAVDNSPRAALLMLLTGWGHQTAWTTPLMQAALLLAGFKTTAPSYYGASADDGHHLDVGMDWAAVESSCVEAFK
jgi:hypothetical protein